MQLVHTLLLLGAISLRTRLEVIHMKLIYFVRPSSTSSGGYYLSAGSVASSLILWVTAAVFGF